MTAGRLATGLATGSGTGSSIEPSTMLIVSASRAPVGQVGGLVTDGVSTFDVDDDQFGLRGSNQTKRTHQSSFV